jgi:lipopolysaccharide export system permease protein
VRILDRYIASRFLRALFFSLLVFLAIFIIVDLVEHLDEFIDARAERSQVVRYYANYVPYIFVLMLPVSMLLATLFSVGTLSKQNELLAMKASGISLYRFAQPLLILGFLISLLTMVFGEIVVPKTNQARSEIKNVEIPGRRAEQKTFVYNLYRQGAEGRIFRFERYDLTETFGFGVLVQNFNGHTLTSVIRADRMRLRDGHWVLEQGEERRFVGVDSVVVTPFAELTRPDWPEKPETFAQREKDPENMGFYELEKLARAKERSGADATEERVALQLKIAFPFSCLIMVLLGVPIASAPKRAGFALSFGITFGIAFVYFTFTDVLQALGTAGKISPYAAAWTMNLAFLAVGGSLFLFTRK